MNKKYEIKKTISEINSTVIFKGVKRSDNTPVAIKTLNTEYPSPDQILKFRYEFELLKELNIDGVVKVYDFIDINNSPAIIEEYFEGVPLSKFINKTLEENIKVFIKAAEILGDIHKEGVIHKDINPNNILVSENAEYVRIIDFGLSTKLNKEEQEIKNPNVLEGTINYLSPEQTGRMNRPIDFRTDYYSLGAAFYKLFTGQNLFPNAEDAMEMVHLHIAKRPILPHIIDPNIPVTLSNILMKLLEKNAEKRYQSNYGLISDLKKLYNNIKEKIENIDFKIAEHDKKNDFQIPQKLYGREEEKNKLIERVDNILESNSEIILVSGYSGIGKSALINEVHKSISKSKGYFVSGKFDQFQKDVPYSALISALRELIKLVLGESDSKLDKLKTKLKSALGENGKLLTDVIPELEILIDEQDEVQTLSPIEAQNRFKFIFENFFRVLADKKHPLIIFLDDLQWVDNATLEILKILIKDIKLKNFLFIGAYRDNEIFLSHPLNIMLEDIKDEVDIIDFNLTPLKKQHINQLISETLDENKELTRELSELTFQKTGGNPFFTKEFLNTLAKEKLIKFNYDKLKWVWDINLIEEQNITGNVVEFMLKNLKKLPEKTQDILSLGACIGNQFELSTLAYISKTNIQQAAIDLWPAVKEGFVIPIGEGHKILSSFAASNEYSSKQLLDLKITDKFLHDRVQQAAYELIPENEKESIHLKIGRLLLENYSENELEERIFFVLEHLNKGNKLIIDKNEKIKLAELNCLAAKKERESNAYEISAIHSNIGIDLLGENLWTENYELAYRLHLENAESEYLSRNFENAEKRFATLVKNSKNRQDRYKVHKIMILYYISINKFRESIDVGIKALAEWGVDLPQQDDKTAIKKLYKLEIEKHFNYSQLHDINELSKLEDVSDREKEVCMEFLEKMIDGAYLGNPDILNLIILTQVNLSMIYGNSESTPSGYVWWGVMLVAQGKIDEGYAFGKAAIELVEKNKNFHIMCRTYHMFGGFIQFWKEHIANSVETLGKAFDFGNNSGDINYSNYAKAISGRYIFYQGVKLSSSKKHADICINFMEKTKHTGMFEFYNNMRYTVLSLMDETEDKFLLNTDKQSEEFKLKEWHENGLNLQITLHYIMKLYLHFMYEDYETAETYIDKAKEYLLWITPQFDIVQFWFYAALVKTALYKSKSSEEQAEDIKFIDDAIKTIENYNSSAPKNCEQKLLILQAERLRIQDIFAETINHFEKAVKAARNNAFIQEDALANELYAKFWFENDGVKLGKIFLNESIYRYKKWEAKRKVYLLKERYSKYLEEKIYIQAFDNFESTRYGTLSSSTMQEALDFSTMVKASQVLSKEIKTNKLLKKMMQLVIENAGAERGLFIVKEDNNEYILIETNAESNTNNIDKTELSKYDNLLKSIINYVFNSEEKLVIADAGNESSYYSEEYVQKNDIKSVLCYPVLNKGRLVGIIYLENNKIPGVFTENRIEILNILSSQLAISLENAILYESLENKVKERTIELFKKNELLKMQNIELERLSTTDQLTNVYNRRYLEDKLQIEIKKCKVDKSKLALIILDIDNFKRINDTFGHNIGDEVLVKVADVLSSNICETDILGRWGGEEFLILLPESDSAFDTAEKIRSAIENTEFKNIATITSSFGVTYWQIGDTKDSFINRADKALYMAKKSGRNKVIKL